MPRVIVSSGHTAKSPGSIANGMREYDLARSIAKAVVPHLRRSGVISLSIPPNLDLFQRLEWINKTGYEDSTNDVAVEIHINDGGKRGIEAWYEGDSDSNSKKLSDLVVKNTVAESSLPNQGSKSEYEHDLGSISFLHETHPVSCLIECCYIDNDDDARFLKNPKNINKLGKGIAKGILEYLGVSYKEATQSNNNTNKPEIKNTPASNITVTSSTNEPKKPMTKPPVYKSPTPTSIPSPTPSIPNYGNSGGGFTPPSNNSFGGTASPGGGFSPMPSREERKEMIKNQYIKILGREPNQNDLNYFLNIGIKEDDLLKKMIDSQEHADLVKARQEVIDAKKKYNDQQTDFLQLKSSVEDQTRVIKSLQESIAQKNQAVAELQHRVNSMIYQQQTQAQQKQQNSNASQSYKGGFLDKLFRAFSDVFE